MILNMDNVRTSLNDMPLKACRGEVIRVSGLTIESKGPPVGMGELCDIHLADDRVVPAEVIGFNQQHRILMPLERIEGIAPKDAVVARHEPRKVGVGPELLGRVIDGLGHPIDGKGPLGCRTFRSIENAPPAPLQRRRITEPLGLGIRSIDALSTTGRGQRIGIFAGSGVGKSTLLGEIARLSDADISVLCLVGERGREVREFIEECLGPEGLARSVVCVATSDTSPIQRVKVPFLAISVAEYFRDLGKDVVLMMDSLTRFAHAQREIGLASGEPPTTRGYCPSVFSMLPQLTERLGCNETGSITGILTVLVDGDDLSDPVADSVRSLLDGHVVLDRKLAEQGHYPAVNILKSVSRLMTAVTNKEHQIAARKAKAIYSTFLDSQDLINIGAYVPGSNPRIDAAVELIEPLRALLVQDVGEQPWDIDRVAAGLLEITQHWNFLPTDNAEQPSPATGEGS